MIVTVSVLLLMVYVLSTFLQYIVGYLGHKLGINIETDMRQELFYHVQRQSFRFFDNTKTGHIMSRISNDLFDIGELAHHGPEDFFYCSHDFRWRFLHHVLHKCEARFCYHFGRTISHLGHCLLQRTYASSLENDVHQDR